MKNLLLTLSATLLMTSTSQAQTAGIKDSPEYKALRAYIDQLPIVDGHEHLMPEKDLLQGGAPDFFRVALMGYVGDDVSNLGQLFEAGGNYLDYERPLEERWDDFQPIYQRVWNTGYWRYIDRGFEASYGLRPTSAENVAKIQQAINKTYKEGIYDKLFSEKGNIAAVLQYHSYADFNAAGFPDFFYGVRYIDELVMLTKHSHLRELEGHYGLTVRCLEDFKPLFRAYVDETKATGNVGFKTAIAYARTLDFTGYDYAEAEKQLQVLLTHTQGSWFRGEALTLEQGRDLTNYLFHTMLAEVERSGLPLSIHTGLQASGEIDIRMSNPQDLIPLFRKYNKLRFDIFHSGWPYMDEFVELGKSWPNVWLNMCWTHIISPEGARRQLSQMLECVPANKVFAFGGDLFYPEQTLGHLDMAKENVAMVLAQKVIDKIFTMDQAKRLARMLFKENLEAFFNIDAD